MGANIKEEGSDDYFIKNYFVSQWRASIYIVKDRPPLLTKIKLFKFLSYYI
jgi:hypothetical protein